MTRVPRRLLQWILGCGCAALLGCGKGNRLASDLIESVTGEKINLNQLENGQGGGGQDNGQGNGQGNGGTNTNNEGIPGANPSGHVDEPATWSAASEPYHLTKDLFVASGVALTIAPGATVLLDPRTKIVVQGLLIANGTPAQPIRFLRSGNLGGGGIVFTSSSAGSELSYAEFQDQTVELNTAAVTIRQLKMSLTGDVGATSALALRAPFQGQVGVEDCTFDGGRTPDSSGILHDTGGTLNLRRCLVRGFESGLRVGSNQGAVKGSQCSFVYNLQAGVRTQGSAVFNACNLVGNGTSDATFDYWNDSRDDQAMTGNWWGATAASAIAARMYDKADDKKKGAVDAGSPLAVEVPVTGAGW